MSSRTSLIRHPMPPHLLRWRSGQVPRLLLESDVVQLARCAPMSKLDSREVSRAQGGIIVIIITQRLNFVNSALPLHGETSCGIMLGDPDDGFALDILYRVLPCVPVVLVSDEKPDQHAGIHLAHVQSTEPSRVARVDVLL